MSILTFKETEIFVNGCELVNVKNIDSSDFADNYCFTFTVEDQYCYLLEQAVENGVNQVDYQSMDPAIKPKADVLDRNRHFKIQQFRKPQINFDFDDSFDLTGKRVALHLSLRDDRNGCVRLTCHDVNLPDA